MDDRSAGLKSPVARVAFICTANRARSPFAAALLGFHARDLPVVVESFGVLDQGGAPALPGAVRAAAEFGVDLSMHRASVLYGGELEAVELAVGFEPAHVAGAVATGGVSPERAFLLTELAQVLEIRRASLAGGQRRSREPRCPRQRAPLRRWTTPSRGRRPRRRLRPAVSADVRDDRPDGRDHRHAALRRERVPDGLTRVSPRAP